MVADLGSAGRDMLHGRWANVMERFVCSVLSKRIRMTFTKSLERRSGGIGSYDLFVLTAPEVNGITQYRYGSALGGAA